ncbi:MAG: hypothetical protein MUF49_21900 [Oculatellaceae cyanobacterium Prado106]|jgi:hypothetical protein|nr:hypothetical protein [Oculatellaceae cyanobacterium Prado106]
MGLTQTLTALGTTLGIVSAITFLPILPQKVSAQDYNEQLVAICSQLNGGKSPQQISLEWAVYIENLIAANQFSPNDREAAYQFFGYMLADAIVTSCPEQTQALIEAQSATSAGYQPPSATCNFNVFSQSPNNSTYTNAANAWGNWFNNFGGRWMPRITGRSTQELYGC